MTTALVGMITQMIEARPFILAFRYIRPGARATTLTAAGRPVGRSLNQQQQQQVENHFLTQKREPERAIGRETRELARTPSANQAGSKARARTASRPAREKGRQRTVRRVGWTGRVVANGAAARIRRSIRSSRAQTSERHTYCESHISSRSFTFACSSFQ